MAAIVLLSTAGCLHRTSPQAFTSPLERVCNSARALDGIALDTVRLGLAEIVLPTGWAISSGTSQDVLLTRPNASLTAYLDGRFVFHGQPADRRHMCTLTRGDTNIVIEAEGSFSYFVSVRWETDADGELLNLEWRTRHVEHLGQVRAIAERVRFPHAHTRAAAGSRSAAATGQ